MNLLLNIIVLTIVTSVIESAAVIKDKNYYRTPLKQIRKRDVSYPKETLSDGEMEEEEEKSYSANTTNTVTILLENRAGATDVTTTISDSKASVAPAKDASNSTVGVTSSVSAEDKKITVGNVSTTGSAINNQTDKIPVTEKSEGTAVKKDERNMPTGENVTSTPLPEVTTLQKKERAIPTVDHTGTTSEPETATLQEKIVSPANNTASIPETTASTVLKDDRNAPTGDRSDSTNTLAASTLKTDDKNTLTGSVRAEETTSAPVESTLKQNDDGNRLTGSVGAEETTSASVESTLKQNDKNVPTEGTGHLTEKPATVSDENEKETQENNVEDEGEGEEETQQDNANTNDDETEAQTESAKSTSAETPENNVESGDNAESSEGTEESTYDNEDKEPVTTTTSKRPPLKKKQDKRIVKKHKKRSHYLYKSKVYSGNVEVPIVNCFDAFVFGKKNGIEALGRLLERAGRNSFLLRLLPYFTVPLQYAIGSFEYSRCIAGHFVWKLFYIGMKYGDLFPYTDPNHFFLAISDDQENLVGKAEDGIKLLNEYFK